MARVFGGQAAAQALVAAAKTVDAQRVPHSLHTQFLGAGRLGPPIDFHVENVRDSAAFSSRRVVALQEGRSLLTAHASFHIPEPGPEHQLVDPDVGRHVRDRQVPSRPFPAEWPDFYRQWSSLDVHWDPAAHLSGPRTTTGRGARSGVWLRTSEPIDVAPALHCGILACVSDLTLLTTAFVPHEKTPHSATRTFTLDHCVWFHRTFRADEWLHFEQLSPIAAEGRAFCMGRFVDARGQHVATATQEGLIREW
ncbi:acyl-CoA thioesterase [Mycobacterium sp. MMS18-G62]